MLLPLFLFHVSVFFDRRYPMFSVAVGIPYNQKRKTYDMNQVSDTGDAVRETILRCQVYSGTHVVAATVLRWPNVLEQCPNEPVQWRDVLELYGQSSMKWADITKPYKIRDGQADHAEYRTLQRFNTLLEKSNKNDFLLFYVLASPCDKRCTSETSRWSILKHINQIVKWNKYAVVFSNIFQPRSGPRIPEGELRESLVRLGRSGTQLKSIGLENIFRCDGQNAVRCTSCSSGNTVTPYCYSETAQPPVIQPEPGTSHSPSRSDQGGRGSRRNSINPQPGPSTNVGSNTGPHEGGSGSNGGKSKRKRRRGKKKKQSTNEGDNVSSSQNGLENRDTNAGSNTGDGQNRNVRGKVLKVGGRRVGRKRRGGGKNQNSKKKTQTNKRKKRRGAPKSGQEERGRADAQSGEKPMTRTPQNRKKKWMNGEMRRVNQPKMGRRKRRRG